MGNVACMMGDATNGSGEGRASVWAEKHIHFWATRDRRHGASGLQCASVAELCMTGELKIGVSASWVMATSFGRVRRFEIVYGHIFACVTMPTDTLTGGW